MAQDKILCPMCGFKNAPNVGRCVSCGAKLEGMGGTELTPEEQYAQRHQQTGFEWRWAFISLAVYLVLQTAVLAILPLFIATYDPQGLPGLLISVALWFVGGLFIGLTSPGRTFLEPAVGALLAAVPTIGYLMWIGDVFQLSLLTYIMGGILGVMITLVGAFWGEKIQMSRA